MPRSGPLLLVYALTLFISALLLFLVQPLIGKLIVPLLGGFPSVWNTCMVFFQAMLLAGYAYAHYSTNWLGERRQAAVHLAVLLVPALVLPLGVYTALVPAGEDNPVPGLLLLLLVSAGLPFFAISTTAPLVQRWFANTTHPAAKDPYFLYAASNVGSMLALLSYPVLVEPNLTLAQQRWAWSVGYGLLVLLLAGCAVLLWKAPAPAPRPAALPKGKLAELSAPTAVIPADSFARFASDFVGPSLAAQPLARGDEEVGLGRALRWVALAFVPSSLMLGVTTYITTDIAAIPLLWVLPLALYLLSFIVVFSHLPAWVHRFTVLGVPVLLLLLIFLMASKMETQMWTKVLLHLVVLFAVALVCHGELARTRPAARHLTTFYLLMSVGGVLGGLFNALLAPLLFTSLAEYPLAMVGAAFLIPRLDEPTGPPSARTRALDLVLPAVLLLVCVECFGVRASRPFPLSNLLLRLWDHVRDQTAGTAAASVVSAFGDIADALHVSSDNLVAIFRYAPPIVLGYLLVERPLRFGLGVAVILFVSVVPTLFDTDNQVLYRDRSFFGVLNVKSGKIHIKSGDDEKDIVSHRLMHGNILHGTQFQGDEYRRKALTYYYSSGPIGQFFAAFSGDAARKDVAVIGLGTGTMASYAEPGQRYTFYEIDSKVRWISFEPEKPGKKTYFTYVQDARERGAEVNIVMGDARLSMEREAAKGKVHEYDLIVVDAFSSDAIPVHLMTREALRIYRDKLKEGGIIVFHTSNRYLRLEPVVANLADDAGLVAIGLSDDDDDANDVGKTASTWVFLAEKMEHFGKLRDKLEEEPAATIADREHKGRWWRMQPSRELGVWSDDYSNLLRVFRWNDL